MEIFDGECVLRKPGERVSTSSFLSGDTISDEKKIAKRERTNERYHLFVGRKMTPI